MQALFKYNLENQLVVRFRVELKDAADERQTKITGPDPIFPLRRRTLNKSLHEGGSRNSILVACFAA
jgi:hypothetical protein